MTCLNQEETLRVPGWRVVWVRILSPYEPRLSRVKWTPRPQEHQFLVLPQGRFDHRAPLLPNAPCGQLGLFKKEARQACQAGHVVQAWSIWFNIGPYGSMWVHMGPYGSIGVHMDPYGSIWVQIHMSPYGRIWVHMCRYGSRWVHMCPYGSYRFIWVHIRPMGPCGLTWDHMGTHGSI